MKAGVEINNLTTSELPEKLLERVAKKVLEAERQKEMSLSIALVGPGRMRKLNKKYRGKNKITDVLSFPSGKLDIKKPFSQEILKAEGLGEIVICPRVAKKNARRSDSEFETELARCLIHGILHLLGYDHEKGVKQAEEMREKEEKYLKKIRSTKSEARNKFE